MKWILLLVSLMSLPAFAASKEHAGRIVKLDLHGHSWTTYNPNDKGFLSIYIEGLPKACDQPANLPRVIIGTDHPLYDSVLSALLAAKMADKPVHITYLLSCTARAGAWDFGYLSIK